MMRPSSGDQDPFSIHLRASLSSFSLYTLGMQKYFHSSNKPLLPIMSKDNCDAVDLSLMAFHKGSVMLKGGHILPTL